MPFLLPNQQRQSTEGKKSESDRILIILNINVSSMTGLKAGILWSHHEETRELRGERDKARNSARCTQARKTTHGLD